MFERYLALGGERLPQAGKWLTLEEYIQTQCTPRSPRVREGEVIPASGGPRTSTTRAFHSPREPAGSGSFRRVSPVTDVAPLRSQTMALAPRTISRDSTSSAAAVRPTIDHRAAWEAHLQSAAYPRQREFLAAITAANSLLHVRGGMSRYLRVSRERPFLQRTPAGSSIASRENGLSTLISAARAGSSDQTVRHLSEINAGVLSVGGAKVRMHRLLRWCAVAFGGASAVACAASVALAGDLGWGWWTLIAAVAASPFLLDAFRLTQNTQSRTHQVWQISGDARFEFWLWMPALASLLGVCVAALTPFTLLPVSVGALHALSWCLALVTIRLAPIRELILGLFVLSVGSALLLALGGTTAHSVPIGVVSVLLTGWLSTRLDETVRAALQVDLDLVKAALRRAGAISRSSPEVIPLSDFTRSVADELRAIDSEFGIVNSVLEKLPEESRATALTNLSVALNCRYPLS